MQKTHFHFLCNWNTRNKWGIFIFLWNISGGKISLRYLCQFRVSYRLLCMLRLVKSNRSGDETYTLYISRTCFLFLFSFTGGK
jgi:hypothetical protein